MPEDNPEPDQPTEATVDDIGAFYRVVLGRTMDEGAIGTIRMALADGSLSPVDFAHSVFLSGEFLQLAVARSPQNHLLFIHNARLKMVRTLLPPADVILDLGGANSPLFRMGYQHPFRTLTMIDLPAEDMHESYDDISIEPPPGMTGVSVHEGDMTDLTPFADSSVDMVWSGQSIEHVPQEAAVRMCSEAFRVLRPGGSFCLDTPNRAVTEIHTRDVHLEFIHPEHFIEYRTHELRSLVESAGFEIERALGICEMPSTVRNNAIDYSDFVLGAPISENIDISYIQFLHCRKPR